MSAFLTWLLGALPSLTVRVALALVVGLGGVLLLEPSGLMPAWKVGEDPRYWLMAIVFVAGAFVLVRAGEAIVGWLSSRLTYLVQNRRIASGRRKAALTAEKSIQEALDNLTREEWQYFIPRLGDEVPRFYDRAQYNLPNALRAHGLLEADKAGRHCWRIPDQVWNERHAILKRVDENS